VTTALVAPSAAAEARDSPDRLCRAAARYLQHRAGTTTLAVYDDVTGRRATCAPGRHELTASVVKVDILAAFLEHHPQPSAYERSLARRMITVSDNAAASALWRQIGGGPGLERFNAKIGLGATHTTLAWGLTSTTAADQCRLLRWLVASRAKPSARYVLGLMDHVVPWQRWGVSNGVPGGVQVALKNGWLPRAGGWQVNSVGWVRGRGHSYVVAALSDDSPSFAYGRATIERLSALAWRYSPSQSDFRARPL
jgi:beta-lactamase class A